MYRVCHGTAGHLMNLYNFLIEKEGLLSFKNVYKVKVNRPTRLLYHFNCSKVNHTSCAAIYSMLL